MKNKQIFTDEGLKNIVGFFQTLLKIDQRLKQEGYKIKNGEFIPPKNMEELKAQFNRDMNNIYLKTVEETKYIPSYFRKMLEDFGGLGTAQKLLAKVDNSEGFTKLWELGRLDLTVEALIIDNKEKYQQLFTEEELKTAKRRLDELNYTPNN